MTTREDEELKELQYLHDAFNKFMSSCVKAKEDGYVVIFSVDKDNPAGWSHQLVIAKSTCVITGPSI